MVGRNFVRASPFVVSVETKCKKEFAKGIFPASEWGSRAIRKLRIAVATVDPRLSKFWLHCDTEKNDPHTEAGC